MIRKNLVLMFLIGAMLLVNFKLTAQPEEEGKNSPMDVGVGLVNRYIFRGLDFGSSPAIQPSLEFSAGKFTLGAWGSYAFVATPTGIEADLYAAYSFDFGLSLGITDYYFPSEFLFIDSVDAVYPIRSGSYFDYENYHFFELNLSQEIKNFYVSFNYGFFNMDDAIYTEIGYGLKNINFFIGGGNKTYTVNNNFNITNIGISAEKELKISQNYSFTLSSSVIINPNSEQIHLVVGLTL